MMAEENVLLVSDDTRVELYTTAGQYLHMTVHDLRSQRIAVAFGVSQSIIGKTGSSGTDRPKLANIFHISICFFTQIKAEGIYLEESGTGNAEFPDDDRVFHLGAAGGRCADNHQL